MKTDRADIIERICEMLAAGQSMAQICRRKDMPAESTVYKWLAEGGAFSERYARAREQQGIVGLRFVLRRLGAIRARA